MTLKQKLLDYLNGPFTDIAGWCSPNIWQIIWPIAVFQDTAGIKHPVAEIGVYHGKFFIGLIVTKGVVRNYAIDVFNMQEFNLDHAGQGNLEALQKNLAKSGIAGDSVEFFRTDSLTMTEKDIVHIRARTGGFSLFSVDGCHQPEHTINDIRLAMALTLPQGLIFVDDFVNPNWPGVMEGVAKLYFNECPRFVPVAFGHNKLFLCHLSYHQKFLDLILTSLQKSNITYKLVKRFGYENVSVNLDPLSKDYLPIN